MATACAPPTAWTSSMPSSAQAARMAGAGRPALSWRGGEATAIWPTPATWAGTTFMMTEEGSGTRPAGTYTPALFTGTYRSVTCAPSPSAVTWPAGRCASCTGRTRRAISSSAALSPGSRAASAPASACAGTRLVGRSTPSKRAVYSRTAAAPRSRTSSQTGRICSRATPVSSAARGRTPASFSLVMAAAGRPRRSITESTRPVYGEGSCLRRTVHMPRTPRLPSHWREIRGPLRRDDTSLRSVTAGADHQFKTARDHPGGQRPGRECPARPQRQRIVEPRAGRQGGELVLESGQPGVLPHPAGQEGGGKRPAEQPRHRQRPVPAHGEQVAKHPGQHAPGHGYQAERGVGRDEGTGLGV